MFRLYDIAPGVRLVSVHSDRYKTVQVDVSMAVPMGENAAANSLLIKLLRRSCKAYPDFISLNNRLSELYGANISPSVSKSGDAQVLSLTGGCLDDKFSLEGESIVNEFVTLLADLVFAPNIKGNSFGSDNLALEKRLQIQEILEEYDDKRAYAFKRCIEIMFENEPFGLPKSGTTEQVEAVKMNEVYAAWKNLLSTAVFQITVVGNVDGDAVADIFAKRFKKIKREPCTIETVFHKKPQRFARHEEKCSANQGKLVIGYRTGMENAEDNLHAETVMIDIFGGNTYSKLFTNIREKQSLAYYCSARLIAGKGVAFVQSGIDTDKEKAVSAGVVMQLSDIRTGKFDDELLASSKRGLKEAYTIATPEGVRSFYASQILKEKIKTPEDVIAGIESVTKQEVCDAASKMMIDKIFMLAAEPEEKEVVSDENK